jgi:tRNA dimethylallyltransferase
MTRVIHVSNAPVLMLTAPTAAGKTALALALGRDFPLEIVSADAFLVYRGMDVGTAKPTPEERARVQHHVVDVVDPWEAYDVTRFVQDAETAIADVLARGRVPLVVGGTGFYLSALMGGLPTVPRADRAVQMLVEADLARLGLDALLAEVERAAPHELTGWSAIHAASSGRWRCCAARAACRRTFHGHRPASRTRRWPSPRPAKRCRCAPPPAWTRCSRRDSCRRWRG